MTYLEGLEANLTSSISALQVEQATVLAKRKQVELCMLCIEARIDVSEYLEYDTGGLVAPEQAFQRKS